MTIKTILQELENANHPVARIHHKGVNFRVLMVGFKKGMILKEHKANLPTILTVIQGKVIYKEGEQLHHLNLHDDYQIPVGELHSVEALEDSICLLSQGE